MSRPTSCEARQQGDEMQCGRCGLTWATNDPERPACGPRIDKRAIPTRATTRAVQRLEAGLLAPEQPAPNRYGCHSMPRPVLGAVTHLAQNGYTPPVQDGFGTWFRTPVYVPIVHVMSTGCGYAREGGAATTDPYCAGCPEIGRA
jgi:hypothetical protein